MEVVQTETFLVFTRLLQKKERKQLQSEIQKLLKKPDLGEESSEELEGILIYDYQDDLGKKRLCYAYDEHTLTLHLISTISVRI